MKKWLAVLVILFFSTGCSFMVKTPIVADYQKLNQLNQMSTRNDVEVMLGTPQGIGVHVVNSHAYDLVFYSGLAGKFSLFGSANVDSGTAFISYQGKDLVDLLYFTSLSTGPEISFEMDFPITKLSDKLILGKSNINVVYEIMGQPPYKGRWIDNTNKISHNTVFWDASEAQKDGAIKEKWLLIGFDNQGIVQDLTWVSSIPEDIKAFGEISEQNLKQITRFTTVLFLPFFEPQSVSTSTKIDPIQVDAILERNPTNIKAFKDVIGAPTSIGIRSIEGNPPIVLSNWTCSKIEIKGTENNFIPFSAPVEERGKIEQRESYMVMDITQTRLIIGHDSQGEIKEIQWFKPIK